MMLYGSFGGDGSDTKSPAFGNGSNCMLVEWASIFISYIAVSFHLMDMTDMTQKLNLHPGTLARPTS